MDRSPGPPTSSSGETARSAVEAILEKDRERREDEQRSKTDRTGPRPGRLLVVVGLAALALWVWLSPPSFVQPPPLQEPTPVEVDTGLRMDMYVAALSVERYRDETGQLPATLDDALEDSADGEDLVYERLGGGTFRLTGVRGSAQASWTSTDPVSELVGGARNRVGGGGDA